RRWSRARTMAGPIGASPRRGRRRAIRRAPREPGRCGSRPGSSTGSRSSRGSDEPHRRQAGQYGRGRAPDVLPFWPARHPSDFARLTCTGPRETLLTPHRFLESDENRKTTFGGGVCGQMRYWSVGVFLLAGLTAGCAASSPLGPTSAPPARMGSDLTIPGDLAGFITWRDGFRSRALDRGIRADVFDVAFRGVTPNAEVLRLDGRQAEFVKPIWEYLDSAVSAERVTTGRRQAAARAETLRAIESRFGVDAPAVLAIWGMETNFGSFRGDIPVIESLATLAYQGRRRSWAEDELIAALRILQAGDADPAEMRGSWAGAMGHTQFIPTSFLAHAVDFT